MRGLIVFALAFAVGLTATFWFTRSVEPQDALEKGAEGARSEAPVRSEATLVEPEESPTDPVAAEALGVRARRSAEEVALTPAKEERSEQPITMIHGRLVDGEGAPMSGFRLYAIDAFGEGHRARADDDGRYILVDLPAGIVDFRIGSHLHYRIEERFQLLEGEVLERDFVVKRAAIIPLRVGSEDGRPLRDLLGDAGFQVSPNVNAMATKEKPGSILHPPHPGGNNQYGAGNWWGRSMCELEASSHTDVYGALVLSQPPPVWVSLSLNQQVLRTRYVAKAGEEVHWTIRPEELSELQGSLVVRIIDALTDEPFEEDRLPLVMLSFRGSFRPGTDGILRIDGLPPGDHEVLVMKPGCAQLERSVHVASGQETDLGLWKLSPPVPFGGRVLNAAGESLALRIQIEKLEGEESGENGASSSLGWSSDEDTGAFRSETHAAGRYLVRVIGDDEMTIPFADPTIWTSQALIVDTRSGSKEDLVLLAVPATLVRVEAPELERNARLAVEDEAGQVLRRRTLRVGEGEPLKLPPGELTLIVTRDGQELGRRSLSVGAESLSVSLPFR